MSLLNEKPALVIYHGGCVDGFTAAYLVHLALDGDVELYPAAYQTPPPPCAGRVVYMVDFTYPPADMAAVAEEAAELHVFDHHETGEENCAGLGEYPNTMVTFDQGQSGAGLVATAIENNYFGPGKYDINSSNSTRIVDAVERRDLWRFEPGDGTAEFFASVTSRPYTIEAWDELFATHFDDIVKDGTGISRYREQLISTAVGNHRWAYIGGFVVPFSACPYAIGSEVAGRLAEMFPHAPFGAYYTDGDQNRGWGLRVRGNSDFNVAQLAKEKFGGGGHPKASGFRTSFEWMGDQP